MKRTCGAPPANKGRHPGMPTDQIRDLFIACGFVGEGQIPTAAPRGWIPPEPGPGPQCGR